MARNSTTTGREKAEAGRPPFTFDNYPNSFRDWDEKDMQEGNRALALFLREAVSGMVTRFNEKGFPNHGGNDLAVRGMEIAFDLLLDRMDMLAGTSPIPFLRDVPGRF